MIEPDIRQASTAIMKNYHLITFTIGSSYQYAINGTDKERLIELLTQTWVFMKYWNSAGVIVREAKTANISSVNKRLTEKIDGELTK